MNTYENKTNILNKEKLMAKLPAITDAEKAFFIDQTAQLRNLLMLYNSAIREVTTKLEILNEELAEEYSQIYKGLIYYNSSIVDWQEKLQNILSNI